MSEDEGDEHFAGGVLGALFDSEEMIPIAPPLYDAHGRVVQVPAHLAKSIVTGEEKDLDAGDFRFPVPLLRRSLSLSKNTPHALAGRLAELGAELISAEHAHRMRLLELETAARTERLAHSERAGRLERERAAIEKALAQAEKNDAAARIAATAAEGATPARAAAATSGGSCLLIPRSPGETSTGDESGCGVCLSADRDTLVAPCGHVAMCFGCADAIRKSRNPECPFCRCRITAVYKLFVV